MPTTIWCFASSPTSCKTGSHNILVDSCIGNDKERTARPLWHKKKDDAFMRGLAAAGLTVNDIDFVLCTHLHVDHIGWNTRLENGRWVPTFPKARYMFSKTELDFWLDEAKKTDLPQIDDSVMPIVEAKTLRPRHQRSCAERPGHADPDARPHDRSLRGARWARAARTRCSPAT